MDLEALRALEVRWRARVGIPPPLNEIWNLGGGGKGRGTAKRLTQLSTPCKQGSVDQLCIALLERVARRACILIGRYVLFCAQSGATIRCQSLMTAVLNNF